jgi:hypothetical protein
MGTGIDMQARENDQQESTREVEVAWWVSRGDCNVVPSTGKMMMMDAETLVAMNSASTDNGGHSIMYDMAGR